MSVLFPSTSSSGPDADCYLLPQARGTIKLYRDGKELVIARDVNGLSHWGILGRLHPDEVAELGEALIELGREPGA
jgi:hypothetical protein